MLNVCLLTILFGSSLTNKEKLINNCFLRNRKAETKEKATQGVQNNRTLNFTSLRARNDVTHYASKHTFQKLVTFVDNRDSITSYQI